MLLKFDSRRHKTIFTQTKRSRKRFLLGFVPLLVLASIVGYRQVKAFFVEPEAIVVLGGEEKREIFAARFARSHPDLPILVSSGSPKEYAQMVFAKIGVEGDRVHLDYTAKDTVTNFTTLVDRLQAEEIESVYLITSDDHMLRARVIGEIVFGSRGIILKPVAIPTEREPEPIQKSLRDGARALLWLTTGYTGTKE